jgi:hypothetical protein
MRLIVPGQDLASGRGPPYRTLGSCPPPGFIAGWVHEQATTISHTPADKFIRVISARAPASRTATKYPLAVDDVQLPTCMQNEADLACGP